MFSNLLASSKDDLDMSCRVYCKSRGQAYDFVALAKQCNSFGIFLDVCPSCFPQHVGVVDLMERLHKRYNVLTSPDAADMGKSVRSLAIEASGRWRTALRHLAEAAPYRSQCLNKELHTLLCRVGPRRYAHSPAPSVVAESEGADGNESDHDFEEYAEESYDEDGLPTNRINIDVPASSGQEPVGDDGADDFMFCAACSCDDPKCPFPKPGKLIASIALADSDSDSYAAKAPPVDGKLGKGNGQRAAAIKVREDRKS